MQYSLGASADVSSDGTRVFVVRTSPKDSFLVGLLVHAVGGTGLDPWRLREIPAEPDGVLWIAMEPHLFPRHILLLLPIASLLFVPALDGLWLREGFTRLIQRVLAGGLAVSILLSAIFAWDYARYDVTGDSGTFHRFTWYYPVYDWINKNTPKASRFLVIVYSGHSYYLDRPYRRADPWLSGVVDWSHVASSADVAQVLRHGGYDYVLYDDRDWRAFPAGAEMASAIRSAVRSRVLVPVHAERERLYTSRVTRDFGETSVYVLRLANQHSEFLPAVSIHPARPDAMEELEKCLEGGAAMMKLLPNCHEVDCSDPRFRRFWERMAEAGLPLLALLSTISTSALGAWPATPPPRTVGPAAASTSSATSSVRNRRRSQFWSRRRRWCASVAATR